MTYELEIAIALGAGVHGLLGWLKYRKAQPADATFDPTYLLQTVALPVIVSILLVTPEGAALGIPSLATLLGVTTVTPALAFGVGMSGKAIDEAMGSLYATFFPPQTTST